MIHKVVIGLIILSGTFHFKLMENTRFYPAQYGFFIFTFCILGSLLLYRKNKYMGYLACLCSLMTLKTYLSGHAPYLDLYKETLAGVGIFTVYYFVRELKLKEDMLKWFFIPVVLNIILVLAQTFDGNFLLFMPVERVTGFLGNRGVSACFIALSTPLFLKYFRKGLILLIPTIILCKSVTAILILLSSGLFYLYWTDRKTFNLSLISSLIFLTIGGFVSREGLKEEARYRLSMAQGTISGILHNPILGWGVGSFMSVISKIPPEETVYWGRSFNQPADPSTGRDGAKPRIMAHPHNEVLYNWWNCGTLYPFLLLLLFVNLIKKWKLKNLLPFSIFVGGLVYSGTYFLTFPSWVFVMFALGIYEN